MEENRNISTKVQDAMNSLDGIQRAAPEPFFFTRLQASLQKEQAGIWGIIISFITKPAVALTSLGFIVLLNAAALIYQKEEPSNAYSADLNEQVYADDYNTTVATNSYYDENIDPR